MPLRNANTEMLFFYVSKGTHVCINHFTNWDNPAWQTCDSQHGCDTHGCQHHPIPWSAGRVPCVCKV